MALSFLYDLFLVFYFLVELPFFLRRISSKSKNWKGFKARMVGPWPQKCDTPSIWIHAVSLGESKAILPIIQKFQSDEPKTPIICTVQSDTAYEFLSKVPGVSVFYAPLDLSFVQRKFVERIRPKLLVLSEGDFWFHQLKYAKRAGAKIITLSGKISEKSAKIYRRIPWISKEIFSINAIGVQNELYYDRFASFLKDPSILSVTGNLKYAQEPRFSFEQSALKKLLHVKDGDFPIALASTHECEEDGLMDAIEKTARDIPRATFFIAPRHPSRFLPFYERLKERFGDEVVLFSDLESSEQAKRICLVNQMGILSDLFRISSVAILAGSFDPSIGGHNLLEPLQAGCPVIFGPHTENQVEFRELILKNKAGWECPLKELPTLLSRLQGQPPEYKEILHNGSTITREHQGTKDKSWQLIKDQMSQLRLKLL